MHTSLIYCNFSKYHNAQRQCHLHQHRNTKTWGVAIKAMIISSLVVASCISAAVCSRWIGPTSACIMSKLHKAQRGTTSEDKLHHSTPRKESTLNNYKIYSISLTIIGILKQMTSEITFLPKDCLSVLQYLGQARTQKFAIFGLVQCGTTWAEKRGGKIWPRHTHDRYLPLAKSIRKLLVAIMSIPQIRSQSCQMMIDPGKKNVQTSPTDYEKTVATVGTDLRQPLNPVTNILDPTDSMIQPDSSICNHFLNFLQASPVYFKSQFRDYWCLKVQFLSVVVHSNSLNVAAAFCQPCHLWRHQWLHTSSH